MPRHRRGWAMEEGCEYQDRHSPLVVSMLEPALLILLKQQPQHGYNLLSDLEALGMGTLHPSVVYRTLHEMERLEWIESDWNADQTQGPPRRTYQLTSQGEDVLAHWKNELEKNRELIGKLLEKT